MKMVAILNHLFTRKLQKKVPEVTLFFWIIKLFTTAFGEALSDFLVFHVNPYIAVFLGFLFFITALVLQLMQKKYIPWIYWSAAAMVAVFGTMAADVLHIVLGIPYPIASAGFFVILLGIFALWHRSEKTLSIHSVYTFKRELFYWASIIATFALGTAVGDVTAATLHVGYLASGIVFTVLIIIPALIYRYRKTNEVLLFWIAYILTRPLGASFADWIGKDKTAGGLGMGSGILSLILLALMVGTITYISLSKKEEAKELGNI